MDAVLQQQLFQALLQQQQQTLLQQPAQNVPLVSYQSSLAQLQQQQSPDPLLAAVASTAQSGAYSQALAQLQQQQIGQQLQAALASKQAAPAQTVVSDNEFFSFDSPSFKTPALSVVGPAALTSTPLAPIASGAFFAFDSFDAPKEPQQKRKTPEPAAIPVVSRPSITIAPVATRPPLPVHPGSEKERTPEEVKESTKAQTQKTNALVTTLAKQRSRSRSQKVKKKTKKPSSSSSDVRRREKKDKKYDKKKKDKKDDKKRKDKKEKKARSLTPKAQLEKEPKKASKKESKETKKKAPSLPQAEQPPAPPPGAPLKPLPNDEIWKQSAAPKLEEPKAAVNPIMAQFMAQQKAAQEQAAKLKEQEQHFQAKLESVEAKRKAAEEEEKARLEAECRAMTEKAEAGLRAKREREEAEMRAMQEALARNEEEKQQMKATQQALLEALSQADTALQKQRIEQPKGVTCSSSEDEEKEVVAKRRRERDEADSGKECSRKGRSDRKEAKKDKKAGDVRQERSRSKSKKKYSKHSSRSSSSHSKERRKKSRGRDRRDAKHRSRKSQERRKSRDRARKSPERKESSSRAKREHSRSRDRKNNQKDNDRKRSRGRDDASVFAREGKVAFKVGSKETSARAAQEIEERLLKHSQLPIPPPPPLQVPHQQQPALMQMVQNMRHQLQKIQEWEVLHPQQVQMLEQLRMLEQQGSVQPHQAAVVEQWDRYLSDHLAQRERQQKQLEEHRRQQEEQRRQQEMQRIFENQQELRRQLAGNQQIAENHQDRANALKDHIAMANSIAATQGFAVSSAETARAAHIGVGDGRNIQAEPKAMPGKGKGTMWARKGGKGKEMAPSLDDEPAIPKAMPCKGWMSKGCKGCGKACGKDRHGFSLLKPDPTHPTSAPIDGDESKVKLAPEAGQSFPETAQETADDNSAWSEPQDNGEKWWDIDGENSWDMAWDNMWETNAYDNLTGAGVGDEAGACVIMKPTAKSTARTSRPNEFPKDLLSMPAGISDSGKILPFWGHVQPTRRDESDEEAALAKDYGEDYDEDESWWGTWVQRGEDELVEKQWTPEEWRIWTREQEEQQKEGRKKAEQEPEQKELEEVQAEDEAPPTCPKGHCLQKQKVSKGGSNCCDGCGRMAQKGSNVFRCEKCDYDLCQRCYSSKDIDAKGNGKKSKGKGKRRNERKERNQYDKRRDYDEAPEKFDEDRWEEPRQNSGLMLISDLAPPSVTWEYVVTDESRRSYAAYLPCPFEKSQCDDFFDEIRHGTDWFQPTGKWGPAPRQTAWMVKKGCECQYQYGDTNVDPQEYPPWMISLLKQVMPLCGITSEEDWPDSCNMNLYEDGNMSVGWHADDERLFQGKFRDIMILSLSLGQKRKFQMRLNFPEDDEPKEQTIFLGDGDLMSMEGMFQKHYQHRVPKEDGLEPRPRINLTWRWVLMHTTKCPAARDRK